MKKDKLTIAIELQQNVVHKANGRLQELIGTKEKRDLIPLVKSFRGRCFKYRNSAGGADRWWLYLKVIKTRGTMLHCITFQKTSYKQIEFNTERKALMWRDIKPFSDYVEITKEDFEEERKKLLQEIKILGKDI